MYTCICTYMCVCMYICRDTHGMNESMYALHVSESTMAWKEMATHSYISISANIIEISLNTHIFQYLVFLQLPKSQF